MPCHTLAYLVARISLRKSRTFRLDIPKSVIWGKGDSWTMDWKKWVTFVQRKALPTFNIWPYYHYHRTIPWSNIWRVTQNLIAVETNFLLEGHESYKFGDNQGMPNLSKISKRPKCTFEASATLTVSHKGIERFVHGFHY